MDLPSRSFRHVCAFRRFRTRGLDTTRSAAGCNSNETSSRTGDTNPYSVVPNQRVAINARRLSTFFSSPRVRNDRTFQLETTTTLTLTNQGNEFQLPGEFWKKNRTAHVKNKPYSGQSYSTATGAGAYCNSDLSWNSPMVKGFDICLPESERLTDRLSNVKSLPEARKQLNSGNSRLLRPGMVLLKNFMPLWQVKYLVKACRKLGVGSGGFYQPGYIDGAKVDLHMMCLGLNWNPEKLTYELVRSVDGCETPPFPYWFSNMCRKATPFANTYLFPCQLSRNVPNTSIIKFHPAVTGRLPLHQDRSESIRVLYGSPVFLFSMGDSAEFLYGEKKDESKAKRVLLESGDVLIYGGPSRKIYHGIGSIIPNSAPEELLEDTGLRPGHLSITVKEV